MDEWVDVKLNKSQDSGWEDVKPQSRDEVLRDVISKNYFVRQANVPQRPMLETLRTEVAAPVTHAASALAFNAPRTLMKVQEMVGQPGAKESYSFLYPEQQTRFGKLLRFGLEAPATVIGGAGKVAAKAGEKVASKVGTSLLGKALTYGIGGGVFGATQLEPDINKYKQNIINQAEFGAFLPFAGKALETIPKAGRFIAKNIGGVTDATVDIIKKLGSNRVFDPLKQKADYIGSIVVPKVVDKISSVITSASNNTRSLLRNLNFNDEQITKLSELNPLYKERLKTILNGENINISQGIDAIKKDASDRFSFVMKKVIPDTAIDIKNFYYNLKNILVSKNWLGKSGEPVELVGKEPARDQLLNIYNYLTKTVKTDTGGYRKNILNIPQYENIRNLLDTMYDQVPTHQAIVSKLGKSLRNEASKVIPGLKNVNKFYSDALDLASMNNEGLFAKILDPKTLESRLLQMKNIYRPNQTEPMRNVIGKDLYDDVLAHFANRDFGLTSDIPGVGGGIYPSRSGLIKAGVSEATKNYYKNIFPMTSKLGSFGKTLETKAKDYYLKQPLSLSTEGKQQLLGRKGEAINPFNPTTGKGETVNFGKKGSLTLSTTEGKVMLGLAGLATAGALATGKAEAEEIKEGKELKGEASTYGWGEKLNKFTFSGEEFKSDKITAAMRNVPMGSTVEVTDNKTGKKVTVIINDGGPAEKTKRVIDLSKGAWKALGYGKAGLADVTVKIVKLGKGKSYPRIGKIKK